VETISFARGAPAPELLPVEELADCADVVLARDGRTILSYGAGAGYTPLRELLAERHGVHPARVVVTNGGLHGLKLLADRLAPGRKVMAEWPTYDRAYKVFLASRATMLAAVVDDDGVIPEQIEDALRATGDVAFVYVIPTFQNPTGTTLALERRQRLVQYVLTRRVPLVEDDPYSLVRFDGEPLPSLFELSARTTIYMSSFSKTISPGLRVAWMVLPEDLAGEIANAATDTYITPVLLGQAVAYEFISRGSFEPNLARVNEQLRLRRDAMLAALERHFSGATWTAPNGGFFVWLRLSPDVDVRRVLERAEGVAAVPGSDFGAAANCVRLAYSFAAPDEMDEGVRRLAAAV